MGIKVIVDVATGEEILVEVPDHEIVESPSQVESDREKLDRMQQELDALKVKLGG